MTAFYLSLVAVAALAELASALSPERGREAVKRIAALLTLLVILAPARRLWDDRENWSAAVDDLLAPGGTLTAEEDRATAAETIFTYGETAFGLNRERMAVIFETGADGVTESIRVRAENCPYSVRWAMEKELTEAFGVPVTVRGEREAVE